MLFVNIFIPHFCISFADNMVSLLNYVVNHWEFQAIVNATYSVDTFFFLSGLLVSYLGCRHMQKSDGKINLSKFYFHRYLRYYFKLNRIFALSAFMYNHVLIDILVT